MIVRKRAWSHPAQVRKDLEELVGTVEHVTKEEDVKLKLELPMKTAAARGVVPRLKRPAQMQAIVMEPRIDPKGPPFFAKLRAEADDELLSEGAGKLYLGFHLDPFHGAHWNNLTKPLSFKLEVPEGVKIGKLAAEASPVKAASDADPREFLLDVEAWPHGQSIRLTVTYFACVGERDLPHGEAGIRTASAARPGRRRRSGRGCGLLGPLMGSPGTRCLRRDKNGDGKLNKDEVKGLILPHFESFDTNKDGLLDQEELKSVADWLNYYHQPGAPPSSRKKH